MSLHSMPMYHGTRLLNITRYSLFMHSGLGMGLLQTMWGVRSMHGLERLLINHCFSTAFMWFSLQRFRAEGFTNCPKPRKSLSLCKSHFQ
jgi:hypothetical protein